MADSMGEKAVYIPNGLDFRRFFLVQAPESRNALTAMLPYHPVESKGSADGLKALSVVHGRFPELRATLYGVPRAPARLPPWARYYRLPGQELLRDLYNASAVFVAPSWAEGWGLAPCEAMMCGAALAATDIGGHRSFATHEETALLSPPKEPLQLAENIMRLIRDRPLRLRIAGAGHGFVRQFTWERSVGLLEASLLEGRETPPAAAMGRNAVERTGRM